MDSQPSSTRIRSFGSQEPLTEEANPSPSTAHRILGRISFSSLRRGRPSFLGSRNDGGSVSTPSTERPPIPTMMNASAEAYMTPLPKLSMIVLSIVSAQFLLSGHGGGPERYNVDYARRILIRKRFNAISPFYGQR